MNSDSKDKKWIRRLLTAAVVLLALILFLQLWLLFRGGAAAGARPSGQDAARPAVSQTVSSGKAAMIEDVRSLNPELSFDRLAALSVEELEQLYETGAPGLPIGLSAAAQAAEEYAGTLEMDSVTCDADPELDESPACYEVELHHITLGDFDYEVDAYTGEVLSGIPDILQSGYVPSPEGENAETPPAAAPAASAPAASDARQSALIGEDAAKAAAFAHAGVREADAVKVRCELDWEDGVQVYEVEFDVGRTEYEYEIDAATGAVRKAEWDR